MSEHNLIDQEYNPFYEQNKSMNLYKVFIKCVTWNEHDGTKYIKVKFNIQATCTTEALNKGKQKAREGGYTLDFEQPYPVERI